jgi:hypothetical protein
MSKEIGFMTSISATARATEATAFSSRRLYAALAGWVLLVLAVFVVFLLALQSGQHTPPPVVPADNVVQQDQPVYQSTEPIYFPGRPY